MQNKSVNNANGIMGDLTQFADNLGLANSKESRKAQRSLHRAMYTAGFTVSDIARRSGAARETIWADIADIRQGAA